MYLLMIEIEREKRNWGRGGMQKDAKRKRNGKARKGERKAVP